jgi:hypothetical protein
MLKFYARHGRFPDGDGDLPREVVEFVARQVRVPAEAVGGYKFVGRTVEYHRAQIRKHFGYRECTVEDADALQGWVEGNVAEADPRLEVVRDELLGRCRKWRLEPPSDGRIERIVRAAVHAAQSALCQRTAARLAEETTARIEALIAVDDGEEDGEVRNVLARTTRPTDPSSVRMALRSRATVCSR